MCNRIRFRVDYYQDGNYEVWEFTESEYWVSRFQGNLSDCEAYIRLRLSVDIEFNG